RPTRLRSPDRWPIWMEIRSRGRKSAPSGDASRHSSPVES
ncbi:MAG: hypothetical protein AMXMBFR75_03180, partial [Candidatus Hinthialibacteria bacterium]